MSIDPPGLPPSRGKRSTDQSLSMSVFETFRLAWADDDLRGRLIFMMYMFAIFTLGVHIPVPIPGLSASELTEKLKDNAFFQLINSFGGGALRRLSVFALGLNPYITAAIIFQVLQSAIPAWKEEMKEGGEYARQAMNKRVRASTLVLCVFQSLGFIGILSGAGGAAMTLGVKVTIIIFWTCGAMFTLWIGEQISERGIGNGVSLMIFAGIIIALPQTISGISDGLANGVTSWWSVAMFIALFLATTWFVVFFTVGQRKIPIQHMRRTQGTKVLGGQVNYLPFTVAMVGVIPIIFAISIIFMPVTIGSMLPAGSLMQNILLGIGKYINPGDPTANLLVTFLGSCGFIVVIFFFTYFYTSVQFNVDDIADNLKRGGSFIPGIRPGKQTSDFLNGVISRLTFVGALFLSVVSLLQFLAPRITGISRSTTGGTYIIGGTTLLILVQVALEFMRQIEASVMMNQYRN